MRHEERVKEIKSVARALKAVGSTKLTKAEIAAMYITHTAYLLKALAKAQKASV